MNPFQNLSVVILAAGKGTRMKSDLPKVLHPLGHRAMIHYVLATTRNLKADPIVVVVGHQKEKVISVVAQENVKFAIQEPQNGTGHAVICALPQIPDNHGEVLILSGDVPLIKADTLAKFIAYHRESGASATVMTALADDPKGYGRIVRKTGDSLAAIIEERDADESTRKINEINSGIYVFNINVLRLVLPL